MPAKRIAAVLKITLEETPKSGGARRIKSVEIPIELPQKKGGARRIPKPVVVETEIPKRTGARRIPKPAPAVEEPKKSGGARRIPRPVEETPAPVPEVPRKGGARRIPRDVALAEPPKRSGGARRIPKPVQEPEPEPQVVDLERALLTKICEDGDWSEIVRNKVTGKHFTNFDCRQVFDWLQGQFNVHGELPSVGVLRTEFPDFSTESTRSGQKTLIDRLRDRKIYADVSRTVLEVINKAKEDPKKGLDELRAAAITLTTENIVDNEVDASADLSSAEEAYDKAKRNKGLRGIPWPWPSLTTLTGGIEAGEFISFYGPPGVMKTWLMLYIAMNCLAFGKTAIFFTFEMTKEEIVERYAAMLAKVDWGRYRGGCLTEEEEARFRKVCREKGDNPPFHIVELEEAGPAAIAAIKSKIKEHGAAVAFIDGLSFVAEDLGWEAFGTTCKELRTLARTTKVSIIATHHSNRNRKKVNKLGNDAEDVALGDTLQRYATQLYRLVRAPGQEENDEIVITMPKQREAKRGVLTINAKPAWDFSEKWMGDANGAAERGTDLGDDVL